jgi:hypothetical protein
MHAYIHTYIFRGSISFSQGQYNVDQVINTQMYTNFTVLNTTNILQCTIIIIFYTQNIHLQYKVSVYLSVYLIVFKAALNFALSFLRTVKLGGKLLNIFGVISEQLIANSDGHSISVIITTFC